MKMVKIISALKQRFLKSIYKKRKNTSYVLMLHEVTDSDKAKHPEISIEKNTFEKMVQEIQAKGYTFDHIRNLFGFSDRCMFVTFDDIFVNVITNALPILEKYNIPFTVFITSEYIDQPGYISDEQLKQLISHPLCTIGFHAQKHVLMREHKNEEIAQIANAHLFEKKYGIHCDYFAYPYGSIYACPKRAIKEVAKLGYSAAFGTIDSAVNRKTVLKNLYYIPRICVSDRTANKIMGAL